MVRRVYVFENMSISISTPTFLTVPEGVPAPTVSDGVPGQVFVSWSAPAQPNGEILYYIIERAQGDENYVQLGNRTADGLRIFGDPSVEPYTVYSYRIVAVNNAGSAPGPAQNFLTAEAGECHIFSDLKKLFSHFICSS